VMFDVAGEHVITLTVSDGSETATATVKINVENPQNCGDGVCSLAEAGALSCPMDCPVCKDGVCGAGEADAQSTDLYCPIDCDVPVDKPTFPEKSLRVGNGTTISALDPNTGKPILGAVVKLTQPNGSVVTLSTVMGKAEYAFDAAGEYSVTIESDMYDPITTTFEVTAPADMGWLLWVVLIVVIIIVVLFLVRFMNMSKKGGASRGGYRASKYRRGKSTLSSL